MDKRLVDEDWKYLCQYLPKDMSESAKTTGTVKRWRKVKKGEELLRIILAYAIEALSPQHGGMVYSDRSGVEGHFRPPPFTLGSASSGEGLGAFADSAAPRRSGLRPGVSH